jgi:hydrogenase maturation protease
VTLRVIGCGNLDRGDDAAGVLVARRLRTLGVKIPGIEIIEHTGDSLSLMDCWVGNAHVVLVDATAPSGEPGQIRVWNAHGDGLPEEVFPCSTHAFGVREAVELARAMNRLPREMVIYGIEGKQFLFGAPLSWEVERSVESVAQQLLELSQATSSAPPGPTF